MDARHQRRRRCTKRLFIAPGRGGPTPSRWKRDYGTIFRDQRALNAEALLQHNELSQGPARRQYQLHVRIQARHIVRRERQSVTSIEQGAIDVEKVNRERRDSADAGCGLSPSISGGTRKPLSGRAAASWACST